MRLQGPAWWVGGLALLLSAGSAVGQGSFQNLNFEQARIVLDTGSIYYPYAAVASNALPGWTAYTYGTPLNDIWYDTQTIGDASVAIFDTNYASGAYSLQGMYSVSFGGQMPGTSPSQSAAIAQTGQIPAAAESMTFFAILGTLEITFNGQTIPYTAIGSGTSHTGVNYTIYGADISAFAGQTGELRFTTPINGGATLDNIQFSDLPIPEPGVPGLWALGALVLGWRGLGRRR